MTFVEIISDIRRQTQYRVSERYQHSDPALLAILNEAQRPVFQRWRDLFVS